MVKIPVDPDTNVMQTPVGNSGGPGSGCSRACRQTTREIFRDLELFMQVLKDSKMGSATGFSVLSLDGNTG